VRVLVPLGDVRADPGVDERADLVALREFLGAEQGIQVQVVAGPVGDRGLRLGDGSGVDPDPLPACCTLSGTDRRVTWLLQM